MQDREVRASYSFSVMAENYLSDDILSGTTRVTINIMDVNDVAPRFDQRMYSDSISESAPVNTSVLTVTATDGDMENVSFIMIVFTPLTQSPYRHLILTWYSLLAEYQMFHSSLILMMEC
jgi:hypothetical protein